MKGRAVEWTRKCELTSRLLLKSLEQRPQRHWPLGSGAYWGHACVPSSVSVPKVRAQREQGKGSVASMASKASRAEVCCREPSCPDPDCFDFRFL
jgi:hypothetical protein